MNTTSTTWNRVTKEHPCPVCEKFDWCLVSADKTACICPRTESGKRCGDAGYLHKLADAPAPYRPRAVRLTPPAPPPDLSALATGYQHAATVDRLRTYAHFLGARTETLIAFRVGWAAEYRAWSHPMYDPAAGYVTGVRLRRPDGAKFSVRGGKEGLFLPDARPGPDHPLLVLEGASDALAAYDLGFRSAAGRPSCAGGTKPVTALVRSRRPPQVAVVGDNDLPGRAGADRLAGAVAMYCRDVRVVAPPAGHKDLRDWVSAGATRADLLALIRSADRRRPNLTIHHAEGGAGGRRS